MITGVKIYKKQADISKDHSMTIINPFIYLACDEVQNDRLVDELKVFRNGVQIATFFRSNIAGFELKFEEVER